MPKREPENKGHQVFISYANEEGDKTGSDRQIADMICSALENEGIRCWIAHRDILAGEDWLDSIVDAVEQSKMIVLIFSSNTEKSQYVKDEIKLALDNKMRIIPFRIEDFPPKGAFKILKLRSQWIDAFTPPLENYVDRLVRDVCTYLEKETETKEKLQLKEKPNDVKAVESKAKKVYKNPQGFQETDFGDGIILVSIPQGEFKMGSNEYDDEKPPNEVYLDGYRIGKYEVTIKQYMKFVNETKSHYPKWLEEGSQYHIKTGSDDYYKKFVTDENCPIVGVSWDDAGAYCEWLSNKTGLNFKLPTEAQREKAARGTEGRKYPWGGREPDETLANFGGKIGKTTPVGSYPDGASPYGLLDMAGNVWEWCSDWYGSDCYKNAPKKNPPGPESGTNRVMRGGSWYNGAVVLRCSYRVYHDPSNRNSIVGFRLCQDDK